MEKRKVEFTYPTYQRLPNLNSDPAKWYQGVFLQFVVVEQSVYAIIETDGYVGQHHISYIRFVD